MDSGRSLMKTKKSKGLSTVPYGTPDVTWATTSCCLSRRNDLIHFNVVPLTP